MNLIHLASFPRSGNKFAQQILHHAFGLKCRSIYSVPFYPDEIAPTWDGVETGVIIKTHEFWTDGPAIYLVRDPRDVYCSYAKYLSHIQQRVVTPKELIEGTSWSEHVCSWRHPNVVVIKYEDLLVSPIVTMAAVLAGLAIRVATVGPLPSWNHLHRDCPWYYQAGEQGRWRTELTEDEIAICEAKNRRYMEMFGYIDQKTI